MNIARLLLAATAALGFVLTAHAEDAGRTPAARPHTANIKAAPGGGKEFPACCKYCPPSGCTSCNSGPEGLSCGSGLIRAECSMSNNQVNCKKDE